MIGIGGSAVGPIATIKLWRRKKQNSIKLDSNYFIRYTQNLSLNSFRGASVPTSFGSVVICIDILRQVPYKYIFIKVVGVTYKLRICYGFWGAGAFARWWWHRPRSPWSWRRSGWYSLSCRFWSVYPRQWYGQDAGISSPINHKYYIRKRSLSQWMEESLTSERKQGNEYL